MEKIKKFLKSDIVFAVSAILAFVSCFFVHPSRDYVGYIDFKTLSLLFCLMITVCGFRSINLFTALGNVLSKKADTNRKITFFMVILCFFSSMFITNDVALITFVPFTIFFLKSVNESKSIDKIVILETILANLGSMLTPVGNPQNLYIYSISNMSVGEFIGTMLPLSTVSLVLVLILCITVKNKKFEVENTENNEIVVDKKGVAVYCVLFLLCIGCVLHILNYIYLFVIVSIVMAIYNKKLFLKVDYILLLTFVFFFVFIGNLSNMESVKTFLESIIDGKELFIGAFLSQFISNVPATILLSKFTENYKQLLYGVNIGGLGTLIGSMASLISYKFYSQEEGADTKKYLKDFSIYGFSLLIILIVFAIFI